MSKNKSIEVGYVKQGNIKCQGCQLPIYQTFLRISIIHDGKINTIKQNFHLECLPITKTISNYPIDQITNLRYINEEDQREVQLLFKSASNKTNSKQKQKRNKKVNTIKKNIGIKSKITKK